MGNNRLEKDMESLYSFKELFSAFVAGTPIKRHDWKGYWKYHYGRIDMFCKDGTVINLCESKDILFTVSNISECDWEIATNENCIIEVK